MLKGSVLLSQQLAERANAGSTPLHAAAEAECEAQYPEGDGTHAHGPWCHGGQVADVSGHAEKGWKKTLRRLLERADSGEFPRDLQPDGITQRIIHDPPVPYVDRPEDEVSSMPMHSTAPAEVKHVDPSALHPGFAYKEKRPELHIADHPKVPHMEVPQPRTQVTPAVSGHYRTGAECTSPGVCEAT